MSDYKYEEASALDAAASLSIGNALRNAREARGETLLDAAHALKLAPKQVEALELERFDLLPGRAFVRGFLRNYARHLGLDGDRLVGRLADSSIGTQPAVDLAPPKNARGTLPTGSASPSRAPRTIVVFVTLMLAALALGWYFDWFKVSEVGSLGAAREPARPSVAEPAAVAPFVARPSRSDAHAAADEDGSRSTAATTESPRTQAPGSDGAVPAAVAAAPAVVPAAPLPTPAVPAGGQSAPAASAATGTVAAADTPAAAPEPAPAAPIAAAAEPGQLLFRLRGESWIQVRDASGATIYMGTGAAGSTRTVQGTPPFAVVVGNATQVVLEHAGKPIDLSPHIRTGVARLTVE